MTDFDSKLEETLTKFLHLREDLEDPTAGGWVIAQIKLLLGEVVGADESTDLDRNKLGEIADHEYYVNAHVCRNQLRSEIREKLGLKGGGENENTIRHNK